MPQPSIESLDALAAAAFGPDARVTGREPIAPWAVMRCTLEGADAPPTVIAKWLREDPNNFRVDPRQIATEQAAFEFLAEVGFSAAPRLHAADRTADLLLLEDLAPRRTLVERIAAEGADALGDAFLAFARLCGALGAATAGQEARWLARRLAYGDIDPQISRDRGFGLLWPEGGAALAAAGLDVPAPVEAEMQRVLARLADPGPFLVFTNGDAHVNNVLIDGQDARLIDFEAAAFRHALVSAAWIHMPGSFWITVAGPQAPGARRRGARRAGAGRPRGG